MATLIVMSGPCEGKTYPLESSSLVSVGRDDQCSFQLVDNEISRRHLQIRYDQDKRCHFAVDMRSANGVFVNGERVTDEVVLKEGDIITVGRSKIKYTRQNFPDEETARIHIKKTDEWKKGTIF